MTRRIASTRHSLTLYVVNPAWSTFEPSKEVFVYMQHDLSGSTLLVADVDTGETIESCVKQLQATAAELFASLVQRARLLDSDLVPPVTSQDSVANNEVRRVGQQRASTAWTLEVTLQEIRGRLEWVNSRLNSAPESVSDTYNVGHVNQSDVHE